MPTLVVSGADRDHLLIEQRDGWTVRAAVFLGQRHAALRQVQHDPRRHVVEVDEARLRRQRPAPRRIHRKPGIDVARAVHRRQPARERVGTRAQIRRPHPPADDPAGQHVETGGHPGHDQSARPLPQPDDGGVVEPHRPFGECREILAVGGVVEPDARARDAGHRDQRCRYSRCSDESRCSRCSSM